MSSMKGVPNISEAEWEIMKVLWAKSPLRSQEIVAALDDGSRLDSDRLCAIGAVGVARAPFGAMALCPMVADNFAVVNAGLCGERAEPV